MPSVAAATSMTLKGRLKAGDKALIHAGSGGVGTFAIQLAKDVEPYRLCESPGQGINGR